MGESDSDGDSPSMTSQSGLQQRASAYGDKKREANMAANTMGKGFASPSPSPSMP